MAYSENIICKSFSFADNDRNGGNKRIAIP